MNLVTRRYAGAVFLIPALLLATTACSGSSSIIATRAVRAMSAVGTFEVAIESRSTLTGLASPTESSGAAQGVVDLSHSASDVMGTSPGGFGSGGQPVEEITIGQVTWVKLSNPTGWLQLPVTPGITQTMFGGFGPITLLDSLKDNGITLRLVGQEAIRGVATKHYLIRPGRYDVWIDANGLVRRIRYTQINTDQVRPGSPVYTSTQVQTAEFFDFGVAANIQAPPPDQVTLPGNSG